jgi:hypothetical protein
MWMRFCNLQDQINPNSLSIELEPRDKALIISNFEIAGTDSGISEDELLDILTSQVEYLMDRRLDYLLSLLYRLDILEPKIKAVLYNQEIIAPARGLAKLILDRQKERVATRTKYKTEGDGSW